MLSQQGAVTKLLGEYQTLKKMNGELCAPDWAACFRWVIKPNKTIFQLHHYLNPSSPVPIRDSQSERHPTAGRKLNIGILNRETNKLTKLLQEVTRAFIFIT